MKFDLFVLPSVPGTMEDRERLRPIGRNNERFQQMIDEMRKLAVMADQMGIDASRRRNTISTRRATRPPLHRCSSMPTLPPGRRTSSSRPVGLVLPGWDPLRCAEEIAILDHLTRGRVIAGFARGYQDRWTNVLGQHYHVTGTPMDGSETDDHNRRVFEEVFKIIKMAWTQETIEYKSEFYSSLSPTRRASAAGQPGSGPESTEPPTRWMKTE